MEEIRRAELELERANYQQAIAQHKLRALQITDEAEGLNKAIGDAEEKLKSIDAELRKDGK